MSYYKNLTQLDCCPDGRVALYQMEKAKKPVWYYRIRLTKGDKRYDRRCTKTVDLAKAKQIAEDRFYEILAKEKNGFPFKNTPVTKKLDMRRPRGETVDKRGVYTITNKYTKTVYVGVSMDIPNRWRQHRGALVRDKHSNKQLQKDWNKWGEWAFDWDLQFYAPTTSREALERQEQLVIKKITLTEGRLVYNTDIRLLTE